MASPEVNVRIRATDGASPVLTLIQGNLARTAASGALAARGMDRVTDAVKDIGRQAAGVDRDVGNLAVGLINLAGGGTLVTAAVGGLIFAYTQLTAASRAAHEENEKFVTSLVATAQKGAPAAEAIRGMDAAVKDLTLHQRQLNLLQNPGVAAGWFGAIAPAIFRALGLTAKAQREIADAQTATVQAGKDYVLSTMRAYAEAVKFGTASDFVRRQLEAYLQTLRVARDDESKTTDARNAAARELDDLTSAMGRANTAHERRNELLERELDLIGQMKPQLAPLSHDVEASLLPRHDDEFDRITTTPLPPIPAPKPSDFEQLRDGLAKNLAFAIGDGIAAGFDAALSSGSIGDGFGQLTGALLSGFGGAMQQFGIAALAASTLMKTIQDSLASFLPGGAIGASIAMIALGSVLKGLGGAAQSAFGGGTSGGGYSGGYRSQSEAETTRIIVQTPSSAHATPATQLRPLHFTVIGTDSAKAQREIKELLRNADARAA